MQANKFFGGMARRDGAGVGPDHDAAEWHCATADRELFLEVEGGAFATSAADELAVLLCGPARWTGDRATSNPTEVVARIRQHYERCGQLPIDRLEGSFSLVALDGRAGQVLLYRNLVGTGFTYYTADADGLWFGSNLADLALRSGIRLAPDPDVLPAFFLFRFVPGRRTLFKNIYRLMPGEQVVFDTHGLRRLQRQTFTDLRKPRSSRADAVEQIEGVMHGLLREQSAAHPDLANLLSGGVDSSYLQAVWNRIKPGTAAPRSFSATVAHPRTKPDTLYAVTASLALGTDHTLVPLNGPYGDYLQGAIATTGEPPNHAMSVYFGPLARAMRARGATTALCGEGADSLFGTAYADQMRTARFLRRFLPFRLLRRWGESLANAAGRECLPLAFRLADFVDDPDHWDHPQNRIGVFADWPAVADCFGNDRLTAALADRRSLLQLLDVGDDPLERVHAVGYLGEGADSASLWTTIFQSAGANLVCPFLDSRLLGLTLSIDPATRFPYRKPKDLLKRGLARLTSEDLAYRSKLGFGQPVFEWLAPGGQLRPWVERIGQYDFLPSAARATALARPGWFLYSLLCFDLWHKLFIDRSLPRTLSDAPPTRSRSLAAPRLG